MIVNANSIVPHVIQIKNGITVNVNVTAKNVKRASKVIVGIQSHILVKLVENSKYLKNVADNSNIGFDVIINVTDNVSTNFHNKKNKI